MPLRKKWVFSREPVPDRTKRWKRRSTRLKTSVRTTLRAAVSSGEDSSSGHVNDCGEANWNSDLQGTFGAVSQTVSSAVDISSNGSSGRNSSDEDNTPSDYEMGNADKEPTVSTHSTDDDQQDSPSDSEDTLPEPNDLRFWENQAGHDNYLMSPLCSFVQTTRGDALLMCLALGLRHSMSWSAIVDMLQMINCLFGQEVVKATKHFFRKYMEANNGRVKYHWYCDYCHRFLGSKQDPSEDIGPCRCGKSAAEVKKAKTFFITFSLEDQIKEILQNQEVVDGLHHRFKREERRVNILEDVYDGELYRALSQSGEVLSKWYNMSYVFNTDGFPVGGKSGKQTCWPIYIQLNELPHKLRSKYMLLAGIYVGKCDPNMQLYMYPFVEEANDLATAGVNWTFNNKKINSKIIPLCACVDTPARSKILNMTAFSGYYGCTICDNEPESTPSGLRWTLPMNAFTERSHRQILVDAAHAHANRTMTRDRKQWRVRGVKGPTPLHNLKFLDLVRGVRPDIMHSIMLGNGKQHFQVLYDSKGHPRYIGSEVRMAAINKRLLSIRPPSSLPRTPRDIERFHSWKAKEWLLWLLFYVVPCLLDIIPEEYVGHIGLLATALHTLMSKSITPAQLENAHVLLLRYVYLFQKYFGKEQMVYNIHLLMHMKKSVMYLGPAWTHMAFSFEGANKSLLEMKKGTSTIAQEIASKYLTFQALPSLCERYASSDKTLEFCQNLSGRRLKSVSRTGEEILVGKGKIYTPSPEERSALARALSVECRTLPFQVLAFDKLIMHGIRYTVATYNTSKKTDDSYIIANSMHGDFYARICTIIKFIGEGNEHDIYLLVNALKMDDKRITNTEYQSCSPLVRVEGEGDLRAISPKEISAQCVSMALEHGHFLCEIPYGCYGDS